MVRRAVVLILAMVPTGLASLAYAGAPTDQIRERVERVYQLLGGPESPQTPQSPNAAVRKIVDEMFDWTVMAREALGRHWAERTAAEQRDFVRLFARLFERAYLSNTQLADAKHFEYLGDTITGDRALVRTRVMTKHGQTVEVNYRVELQNGTQWKIDDLVVEGVSFVRNYRAQFNAIIVRSSYESLLEKLKRASESPSGGDDPRSRPRAPGVLTEPSSPRPASR